MVSAAKKAKSPVPEQVDLEALIAGEHPQIEVGPYTPGMHRDPPENAERDPVTFAPIAPEEGPTIGEVVTDQEHALADAPYMPSFTMTDEPVLPPGFTSPVDGQPSQQPLATETHPQGDDPPSEAPAGGAVLGDILSPRDRRLAQGAVRYEGRIRVLEAFQYLGRLDSAPAWVDRSWAAFFDFDELRRIPAGPGLRVPVPNTGNFAICRVGDYICQQEIVLDVGVPSDVRVEVWSRSDFEKNFLAVANV